MGNLSESGHLKGQETEGQYYDTTMHDSTEWYDEYWIGKDMKGNP